MTGQQTSPSTGIIGVIPQKIFGLHVDRDILFSNHKRVYKKGIEKRQRKLIIKVPFLKPFIRDNERVLCVTKGHSPITLFEKLGIGWLFVYLKRSLFVFTDQRIFHIPTTPVYKYRQSISEIPYSSCRSIRIKGRALVIEYKKTGFTEKFFSLAGKEKKKISALLNNISLEGNKAVGSYRTHLCPRCAARQLENEPTCRGCELKFKTFTMAALLAILFPGGGYYYVHQYFLGAIFTLWELLLIGIAFTMYNDYAQGGLQGALLWLIVAVLLLVFEKSIAVLHAGIFIQDLIPASGDVAFRSVPSNSN